MTHTHTLSNANCNENKCCNSSIYRSVNKKMTAHEKSEVDARKRFEPADKRVKIEKVVLLCESCFVRRKLYWFFVWGTNTTAKCKYSCWFLFLYLFIATIPGSLSRVVSTQVAHLYKKESILHIYSQSERNFLAGALIGPMFVLLRVAVGYFLHCSQHLGYAVFSEQINLKMTNILSILLYQPHILFHTT